MKAVVATLLLFCLFTTVTYGEPASNLPPIKEVMDVKPNTSVFTATSLRKPLVIKSEKDAAKHLSEEALVKLTKQADFKRQVIVLFAWKGSGRDRLSYDVLESFPEQIVFNYQPGRTRDLRPHVHIYVLRSNVKWRLAK
jgi:hypothetical protein